MAQISVKSGKTLRLFLVSVLLCASLLIYFALSLAKTNIPLVALVSFTALLSVVHLFWWQSILSYRELSEQQEVLLDNLQGFEVERQQLCDSLKHHQTLLDSIPDLVWIKDADGRFLAVNAHFKKAYNVNHEELIGKTDFDLSNPKDAQDYRLDDVRIMETKISETREFLASTVTGGQAWIELIKVPVIKEGVVVGTAGTARDITVRKKAQKKLATLAHYDSLTQLKNRHSLELDLIDKINKKKPFMVAFIDLDNFKLINDSLGHAAGDKALRFIADKLVSAIGDDGEAYRLSGDEFIVIIKEVDNSEAAHQWAKQLLVSVSASQVIEGYEFDFSSSIGMCLYPEHGNNAWDLIRHSDIAMYQAKISGKKRIRLFEEQFAGLAIHQLSMEKRLRKALDEREFFVKYQPMVSAVDGRLVGLEALIRWQDPEQGEIGPLHFISFAEQFGLIAQIGFYVIEEVLAQLATWQSKGYQCVPVSVNISGVQFYQSKFVEKLQSAIENAGVPSHLLELEMTESILMKDEDKLLTTFSRLRDLGLSLSVDDFGTGYSNLAYLSRYPINKLKIDRSFIADIDTRKDRKVITQTIISLANNLGLSVIAEGVETVEELNKVVALGCQDVQGFLFSKPAEAGQIESCLSDDFRYPQFCRSTTKLGIAPKQAHQDL